MRRVFLALSVGLAAGCGGSGAAVKQDPSLQERDRAMTALRQRNQELTAQVRELSARLALGEAELQELRAAHTCDEAEGPRKAVRIGRGGAHRGPVESLPRDATAVGPDDGGTRPVLRLYGARTAAASRRDPGPVPRVPEGLPDRLPVVPLPDAPGASTHGSAADGAAEGSPADDGADPVREAYREGLALIQQQRFAEAESHLDRLLAQRPRHPRAPDVLYWRAEALYALRRYDEALRAFSRVLSDYGDSSRAGEAMFKMGLCEKRLGRGKRARALFERVQRDFPGTVAARMAAQEDPS